MMQPHTVPENNLRSVTQQTAKMRYSWKKNIYIWENVRL